VANLEAGNSIAPLVRRADARDIHHLGRSNREEIESGRFSKKIESFVRAAGMSLQRTSVQRWTESLSNLGCRPPGTAFPGTTLLCLREMHGRRFTIAHVIALCA
jgi:hypothetical protein